MQVGPRDMVFWVLVTVLVLGSGIGGGYVVRVLDRPDTGASDALLTEVQGLAERRARDLAEAEAENRTLVVAAQSAETRYAELKERAETRKVALRTLRTEARERDAAEAKRVARVQARKLAREKAAAAEETIIGELTVADINGALVVQVGGYPGQPLDTLDTDQLDRLQRMFDRMKDGRTYPCAGGAGGAYDDVLAGTQVTAADASGTVLATGELAGGTLSTAGCTFSFELRVPPADLYRIGVAGRGDLSFSAEDLETTGWTVDVRL